MNNTDTGVRAFGKTGRDPAMRMERVKIIFQFALMTACSFVIGILLIRMLPQSFYSDSVLKVSTHFETLFINCGSFYDYIRCILKYSLSDIICIAALFCVSFAAFNYVASDVVLIYNGIRTGSAVSFLWAFISSAELAYKLGVLRYVVFVVFKSILLLLVFDYSCRAAIHSRKLKSLSPAGRPNVKPRALFPFIVNTLTYVGSVIILNGIYCFLIYVLK